MNSDVVTKPPEISQSMVVSQHESVESESVGTATFDFEAAKQLLSDKPLNRPNRSRPIHDK